LVLEKFHNYIIYFKKKSRDYDKKALMKRAFYSALRKTYRLTNNGKQFAITDKQIEESKKLLKRYYDKIDKNEPDVYHTEKYFEIDLGDGLWLKGYIDRIDRISENTFKIVDYKTSKAAYPIDKNDQLNIYAIGFKKTLDKEDVEIFKQLDFLKIGKTSPPDPAGQKHNNDEDKEILDRIRAIGQEIRSKIKTDKEEKDWTPTDNDFCWCCDFKDTCYKQRGMDENIFG
jgi:putative RecB family exonuclease